MSVAGFTHVSLSVSDLDRSTAFYRDVLGLPVLVDRFQGTAFDGEEIMFSAGRLALCLQAHRSNAGAVFDPTTSGLDHVGLLIDSRSSLDDLAERLTAAGIAHSGVRPLPGYGLVITVEDPDGIQLELHLPSG